MRPLRTATRLRFNCWMAAPESRLGPSVQRMTSVRPGHECPSHLKAPSTPPIDRYWMPSILPPVTVGTGKYTAAEQRFKSGNGRQLIEDPGSEQQLAGTYDPTLKINAKRGVATDHALHFAAPIVDVGVTAELFARPPSECRGSYAVAADEAMHRL